MDELKDKGKRVMENIGEKRVDMIQKWEEKSRDFIDAFLLLFGREGRLVSHCIKAADTTILSPMKIKIAEIRTIDKTVNKHMFCFIL
jgi:trimethylamine:corrinoid methyltransferase-like protein